MDTILSRSRCVFVLITVAALSTTILRAQCPPDAEFPYYFCKDGKLVVRCTADPHHVWEGGQQLKPFKRYIPGCLTIERGRAFDIHMPAIVTGGDKDYVPVYVVEQEVKDISDAFNQWNALCPKPSNQEFDCCVKIFLSPDQRDFPNDDQGVRARYTIDASTCRPSCTDERRIYINDTPLWLYGTENPDPSNFEIIRSFYTGRYPPSIAPGYRAYSLYQAAEYIMGYWFGMVPGDDAAGSGCEHPDGIMENPYTESEARNLTEEDKCQFRKLYCDHEVGLGVGQPAAPALAYTVTPNPTHDAVTIRFATDHPLPVAVIIRLVDTRGTTVKELRTGEARTGITLDLSDIPNGMYMLTLTNGPDTYGEKIVVQR